MPNARQSLRETFDRDGYCLAPALLDAAETMRGRLAIERFITPETPASVAHIWGTRRQTHTPEAFIPELDEFAYHPRVLDAVGAMLDGPFRLHAAPIVVVTFTGTVCGDVQTSNWLGHLDGVPTQPFEKIAHARCSLWLSFADIETMGGAMVVVPGSHHHVHRRALADPAWVEYRTRNNGFTRQHHIEGMPWDPVEVTCKAGDGFFYHGHAVHSASDNHRQQARIVAIYNYASLESDPATAASLARSFSVRHLESMSMQMRKSVVCKLGADSLNETIMKIAYIGGWGHNYTGALVKNGRATAAVGNDGHDADACQRLAGRLGALYFDSPLKMLAEFKPDIVSVGAVYGHIGANIILALEHGFAVTAEKPIASSFADLERIRELTRTSGLSVVTEFDLRSNRAVVAAQQAVKNGVIGDVILATAQKSYRWGALPGQPPTRPAWYGNRADYPGTIMWVASHGIDGVLFITGQKFTRVFTAQGNLSQPALLPMEDHTASTFMLGNGGTAMVHADLCRPAAAATHGDDRFRIVGTLGQLEVRDARCKLTRFDRPESDITESVSPAPTYDRLAAALGGDATMPYSTADSLETARVLLMRVNRVMKSVSLKYHDIQPPAEPFRPGFRE